MPTSVKERVSVRLLAEPLDAAAALAAVQCPEAGGIDLFLGATRAEEDASLGALVHLDYAAYPEMAVAQLRRLVEIAQKRWRLLGVAVWHRLGTVAVGEASVVIAVSCAHRSEAFEACRFLIEELKASVPIWKKEVYARSARWQGETNDMPGATG